MKYKYVLIIFTFIVTMTYCGKGGNSVKNPTPCTDPIIVETHTVKSQGVWEVTLTVTNKIVGTIYIGNGIAATIAAPSYAAKFATAKNSVLEFRYQCNGIQKTWIKQL